MKLAGHPERLLLPLHERVGAMLAFVAGFNEVVRQEANADRVVTDWNCEDEQPSLFVKLRRAFRHDKNATAFEHNPSFNLLIFGKVKENCASSSAFLRNCREATRGSEKMKGGFR